jgi:hypothetical protein
MARPNLVYSSTSGRNGVIAPPVTHSPITDLSGGGIRATCLCRWSSPTRAVDYDEAQAQYDEHASGATG